MDNSFNVRLDVGAKSMLHMNIQLSKAKNIHIALGTIGSGIWGGLTRD